jgi:hypothetical protein
MKYPFKNLEKTESSDPDSYKLLQIEGRMGGCYVYYFNFKGGPDVIDTELEEEFIKVESSPDVRIPYKNLPHVYLMHEDDLKALGCTRLLYIFHEKIDNDILDFHGRINDYTLNFHERINEDSLDFYEGIGADFHDPRYF